MLRGHSRRITGFATLAAAVLVVAIVAAGCGVKLSSASASPGGGYSFAAYGDIRPNSSATNADYGPGFHNVMAKLGGMPHAFDVVLGDIIQNASGRYTMPHMMLKYRDMYSQLGADARFHHVWVVGNHEGVQTATGSAAFDAALHPGPHWYTYSYGAGTSQQPKVLVIVLSTEEPGYTGGIGYYGEGSTRNSPQANWLVDTLRAHAHDPHTYLVVAMHRPIADSKPHESFAVNGQRVPLETLFTKYGVDLVLNGHVHAYIRHEMPTNQAYMTVGTGGSPLYGPHSSNPTQPGVDVKRIFYEYGFTMFHVSAGGTLTATNYSVSPVTWQWRVSDAFTVPQQQPTG